MKKLLCTSILAASMIAANANAEGPTVTLGGYADFQLGVVSQDSAYEADTNLTAATNIYSKDVHSRFTSNIFLTIAGKTENDIGYGAYLELEASSSSPEGSNDNGDLERGYVFIEGLFGRVELGSNSGASETLRVDASTFARATGGINGDYWRYVDLDNNAAGASTGNFYGYYMVPGLVSSAAPSDRFNNSYEDRETANKITYYTPKAAGFQMGISYTPDQNEQGNSTGFSSEYNGSLDANILPQFENVISAGVSFEQNYNDVDVKLSLIGEWGDSKDINSTTASNRDDLKSYSLGLNVSYAGFTVGGSYADIDEYGALSSLDSSASYWTVGAAYENGPVGVSVGYLKSTVENITTNANDAELSNLSFGADYQIAPGLVPYVEVSLFDTDDNEATTTNDNDGSVILVGTELSF